MELGTDSIKVAEVSIEKDGVRLLKSVSAPLDIPADASRSDKHKITVNLLKGLLKSKKISTKEAVFCVAGQTVFVRRFKLPKTSPERLARIINYEARQQIPFPIEKTMLEYQIYEEPESQDVDVFLVALKKDVLYDFMDIVDKTGLKPMGVNISNLALFNFHSLDGCPAEIFAARFKTTKKKIPISIKFPPFLEKLKKFKKNKDAETAESKGESAPEFAAPEMVRAYLNIGATMSDLTIGSSGAKPMLGFTRSIPVAGNAITQAIMDHCEGVKDFKEAEQIKRDKTAILSMSAEISPSINEQASEAATGMVDRLIAELRRSLDFYISQPDGMAVDEIILSGGQSLLPNLASYIEEKLGITTIHYTASAGTNIKGIETAGADLCLFPIPIGLAIAGLGQAALHIDFLPSDRKVAIKFKRKKGFVILLAAMVAGTILLGSMSGNHYIAIYRDQTGIYQDEYVRNSPMIKRIENVTKVEEDLKAKFDNLSKGLTSERAYPLFRWLEILEAKPADVLVSSLKIFPDGRVVVEGYTEDQNSAVKFSEHLNDELVNKQQSLEGKGARLDDIRPEFNDLFKKDVYKFSISMKYKGRFSRVQETQTAAPTASQQRGPAPSGPIQGPIGPIPRRGGKSSMGEEEI